MKGMKFGLQLDETTDSNKDAHFEYLLFYKTSLEAQMLKTYLRC